MNEDMAKALKKISDLKETVETFRRHASLEANRNYFDGQIDMLRQAFTILENIDVEEE